MPNSNLWYILGASGYTAKMSPPQVELFLQPENLSTPPLKHLHEAIAIQQGVEIVPKKEHIAAISWWADECQKLTQRALQASNALVAQMQSLRRAPKEAQLKATHSCRITRRFRRETAMADHKKAHDVAAPAHGAIDAIITTVVDAINDTEHALGSGKKGLSVGDYGNLITDIMALAGEVGDLPAEIKAMDAQVVADLIKSAASRLEIDNQKAKTIVQSATTLVYDALTTTLRNVENLAGTIKDAQGDAK